MSPSEESQRAGFVSPLFNGLRVLRERWWIVLGVPAICVILALGHALTTDKQYEDGSKLLMRESSFGRARVGVPELNNSDPERQAATNLSLITSNAVARRVARSLRPVGDPDELADQVDVKAEPNSDLVDITASDTDPRRAAAIANAFAREFVGFRRETDQRTLVQGE